MAVVPNPATIVIYQEIGGVWDDAIAMQLPLFQADPETTRLHTERMKLQGAALSANTVTGYAYDWSLFAAWCDGMQRAAQPSSSETLLLFLTDQLAKGKKVTTAIRRCSAIGHYHRTMGLPSPVTSEVRQLLVCAQRQRGEQPRQMRPLSVEQLRTVATVLATEGTPVAYRDRAILTVGFASALRRASIAELALNDVQFVDEGLVINVRREKQDQEGRGRLIGVPRSDGSACPVRALRDWLDVRGFRPGPLFVQLGRYLGKALDGEQVYNVVKKRVAQIGLDPSDYGGHSLRAGFVTAAGEAGVGEFVIAAQTGHRSLAMLRRYFRRSNLFRANACSALAL